MTKVLLADRGKGKTTALINMAKEYNGYIVCRDMKTCTMIHSMAIDNKISINFPITYDEFKTRRYGFGCKKFFIDDVDSMIQGMSSLPVEAITLTSDEYISKADAQKMVEALLKETEQNTAKEILTPMKSFHDALICTKIYVDTMREAMKDLEQLREKYIKE